MPGKYSHSVVLANYTTLGVISLPQDQYDRYKDFAPKKSANSTSTNRLNRARSAQPMYRPPSTSQEEWNTIDTTKIDQARCTSATPGRTRRTDPTPRRDFPDELPSRVDHRIKLSRSTPIVNDIRKNVQLTAYQRQQQLSEQEHETKDYTRNVVENGYPSRPNHTLIHSVFQASKISGSPDSDYRPKEHLQAYSNISSKSPSSSETLVNSSARTPPAREKSTVDATTQQPRNNDERVLPKPSEKAHMSMKRSSILGRNDLSNPQNLSLASESAKQQYQTNAREARYLPFPSDRIERSQSTESRDSRNMQIWDPRPDNISEPAFDGFSDAVIEPQNYFEVPRQVVPHSRDSSTNTVLPIQRQDWREGKITSSPAVSSLQSTQDHKTPTSKAIDSSYEHRSATSNTSTSTTNDKSRTNASQNDDTKRVTKHYSGHEKGWALPEFKEDHGFSPSIFEDHEGRKASSKLEFLDLELSIGRISSGKDVNFDDDTASELSAALPPPISRFKDEQDEFNANMARLFGSNADQTIKNGSQTVGRRAPAKKGFFSKFRSKS